ncbi:diphosphomevalonate/mevalonate 3,5-bisphosphate decarboxylase family protein [Capnocytophaga endodontalis]|uniref:Diphosphomevalonate decarboxylase n=1 Tax=Capnocytophaga endodontalis TaxID=2708117 RepID=A0A1Z4BL14_9FLAO|nr:diphosphomevalonate decarboxylase [Capnocytophaga endodontalis]ASF41939.1 diphosphomevalonate decarboxylase [Capnocytophaga endodontalis]
MTTFKAPSNIALVKYWGKKGEQLPANPSISFTLTHCYTETSIDYERRSESSIASGDSFSFNFSFEGQPKPSFHPKINTFFERILPYLPFLKDYHFNIASHNSFPHSSGIASSASAMAALSVCLMKIAKELGETYTEEVFWQKASFLARLGSGSACRSVKGSIVVWGEHPAITGSSDEYGITYPLPVHEVFQNYQDTILLIDRGQKQVSSTVGHNLMHGHPFAEARFAQANEHINQLVSSFASGDLDHFMEVVESEALTLHAMMQTSIPYFILMRPNTLEVIQRIWQYRKDTKVPLCFTLDAGANVHLLYPKTSITEAKWFIEEELAQFCEGRLYIHDEVGQLI